MKYHYMYLQISQMEQSRSRDTDSVSAEQGTSPLLCNQKVQYGVYKSPPLVPILIEMKQIHILITYFSKTYLHALRRVS
jgi:hypothetical protein